jgi:hypothetical protein
MNTTEVQQATPLVGGAPDEIAVVVTKQTTGMFVLTELCVYASQILMFFFVAALTSNLLRDEKQLLAYLTSRINENTMFEVAATMLAIAATLGIVAAIAKAAPPSSLLQRLADEVLAEAPRTAYVFGSGVAGTLCAAAIFIGNHPGVAAQPPAYWLMLAGWSAFIGFAYGCAFAYAFKHRAFIKASKPQVGTSAP